MSTVVGKSIKKFVIRILIALLGLALLTPIIYTVVRAGDPDVPGGMYASFEFFGHAQADVMEFKSGKVMLRTCCGNESFGSYHQENDDRWIWIFQRELRPADRSKWRLSDPIRFVVIPERFAITIEAEDKSSPPLRMPRRVFEKINF
jgi:hypothetical protein